MKKLLRTGAAFLLITVMVLSLAGCGTGEKKAEDSTTVEDVATNSITKALGSAQASLNLKPIKPVKDLFTKRYVLQTESTDQYDNYEILYYGSTSNIISSWHFEIHYNPSSGVTPEGLNNIDIDTIFPGFSSLDFASAQAKQQGDVVCWLVRLTKLDDPDNVKAAMDCGIISISNYEDGMLIGADMTKDAMIKNGAVEVKSSDLDKIHSDYDK